MRKEKKSRRLTLTRETVQVLNDPALLEGLRGGQINDLGNMGNETTLSLCNDRGTA